MTSARWIRIRLASPRLGLLEDLFWAAGAEGVTLARGGRELVARFPPEAPVDLVDRVEGWLTLVDREGARLETAAGDAGGPGGWVEGWRAIYSGALVGDTFAVRPTWTPPTPGRLDIVIDPRGAFGSGLHPTTRMALLLMEGRVGAGALLDLGAGSGVLSVAAARMGAQVTAVENNLEARETCRRTAALNGVHVDVEERPLDAIVGQFPQIVANLPGPVLLRLAPSIRRLAAPGALLALSGWRPREREAIAAAFPGVLVGALAEDDFAAVAVTVERGPSDGTAETG